MIRKISIWIMAIMTVIVIVWDIYAYIYGNGVSTFSVIMTDWAFYTPILPFAWGFVMGHWFAAPAGSKKEHVG